MCPVLREFLLLVKKVCLLLIAGWIFCTQLFMVTQVHGLEMFPALKDGDLTFTFRLQKEYAINDVVAYRQDGQVRFGRVVAFGDDMVAMDESGTLVVNGTPQGSDILYPTYSRDGSTDPVRVPDGGVYILGDYRTKAKDSRDFGAVPKEQIIGKVITILRRRGI